MTQFKRISALGLFLVSLLPAATVSFSGSFLQDDQVATYSLMLAAPATVTVQSNSYASGGFSPVLSLFEDGSNGLLLNRDNGVDHASGDADLTASLAAGSYMLALTQYDNLAAGPRLSNGFLRQGDTGFTREFGISGAMGPFLDIDGDHRSGAYTLIFSNVTSAAEVPEPRAIALLSIGIAALAIGRRNLRIQSQSKS